MSAFSETPTDEPERFMVEATEQGCVWGLEGPEGWALAGSERYRDSDVLPLWSDPDRAGQHCRDEWAQYQPIPIALGELLDDWLVGMHKDELLVGLNWDEQLEGEEWEPLDLLQEFERALSQP